MQLSRTGQHVWSPICHNAGHQFVTILVTSAMRFEEAPNVMTPLRYVWSGGTFTRRLKLSGLVIPVWGCRGNARRADPARPQNGTKTAPRWPKMAPRRPQNGLKMAATRPKRIRPVAGSPARPQDGPKTAPRWSKMAPRRPQNGPKMAQDGSKTAEDSPKTASKRPQDGPRWPQDGRRWPQDGRRWPKIAEDRRKTGRSTP